MGRSKKDGFGLRFIRNHSQATAHNVYLLLYPKRDVVLAASVDHEILNKIFNYLKTVPNLELAGRTYGGGLNKLEPKELANVAFHPELAADIRSLARAVEPIEEQGVLFG
jgi:hypothetical protein